jgi:hypothetical protein
MAYYRRVSGKRTRAQITIVLRLEDWDIIRTHMPNVSYSKFFIDAAFKALGIPRGDPKSDHLSDDDFERADNN